MKNSTIPNGAVPPKGTTNEQPVHPSKIYRYAHLNGEELGKNFYDNVSTLYDSFNHGYAQTDGNGPCLGARTLIDGKRTGQYSWQSYSEIKERATDLGSGMAHLGFSDTYIGIYSINSLEWVLVDLACVFYSQVDVPMYDTFGTEALIHIVNQTSMKVIATTADKLKSLSSILNSTPSVLLVIVLDQTEFQVDKSVPDRVRVISLRDIERVGKEHRKKHIPPTPDTVYTISYTSGTAGMPKGVILTHRNAVSSESTCLRYAHDGTICFPTTATTTVHYSYLPMSHIFERLAYQYVFTVGGSVGISCGDVLRLLEDVQLLRPTMFIVVPRVLYRMYEKINDTISQKPSIVQTLFRTGLASKLHRLRTTGSCTHAFWDLLVFNKVKSMLGGRIKSIVCGSAPINGEVLDFLSVAFCCPISEGWGMTESFAAMTCTLARERPRQQVGYVGPNVELKLVDVPDLNYFTTDKPYPRGEVCVRGTSIFQGYFNDPEKTREAFDDEKWFHTGDIGAMDEKNRLRIIDRKKQIFKLSQGEYIAPEKVEIIYGGSKFVSQVFVYGDSYESYLVAIVVPNQDMLTKYCKEHSIIASTYAELIKLTEVNKLVLESMNAHGKTAELRGFELVRAIHLEVEPFDVARNMLTPTFKFKRPQIKEYFDQQLKELYQKSKK